jgi:hypothetical protein
MKLSFQRSALMLSGDPFMENGEVQLLSHIIANQLAISTKGEAVKFYDWALQIYKLGYIENIDRSDFDMLKNFVKGFEISNIIKAQLLDCFILQPDEKKK